jgi:uncharacterized protein (TIGR03435 family)
MKESSLALVAAVALTAVSLHAQTSQQKPSFEVISIKPVAPVPTSPFRLGEFALNDRYMMDGATLRMLLQTAFRSSGNTSLSAPMQIIGAPDWIESEHWEVEAKADCRGGPISRDRLQLMVQSLLEDRFQLKAHMEARELPIYRLVTTKDGLKIKRSADQTPTFVGGRFPALCEPLPPPTPRPPPGERGLPFDANGLPNRGTFGIRAGAGGLTLYGAAVPFTTFVRLIEQQLGRTLVDVTGLAGLYDFTLTFSSEGLQSPFARGPVAPTPSATQAGGASAVPVAADPAAPSIFTSIQQLGLKLESIKAPADVLVIDSVQKPTEN